MWDPIRDDFTEADEPMELDGRLFDINRERKLHRPVEVPPTFKTWQVVGSAALIALGVALIMWAGSSYFGWQG